MWIQKTYDNGLARSLWQFEVTPLTRINPLSAWAGCVELRRCIYRWDKECFEELETWYFTEQLGVDNYLARCEDKFPNPMHIFKTLSKSVSTLE